MDGTTGRRTAMEVLGRARVGLISLACRATARNEAVSTGEPTQARRLLVPEARERALLAVPLGSARVGG